MLGKAQQHTLLNSTSSVLCPTAYRHQHRRTGSNQTSTTFSARGVRPVSAATVAGPGIAAAAPAAEGQQRVTTAADPKAVIQGTPLKEAKLAAHYDAIVVGSGMGGLAAAVALSKYAGVSPGVSVWVTKLQHSIALFSTIKHCNLLHCNV